MAAMDEIRAGVARRLELPEPEVFDSRPLSAVLAASPVATNSIDLLDAFAGALTDQGRDEDLDLPAFTLDHSANEVLAALEVQLTGVTEHRTG